MVAAPMDRGEIDPEARAGWYVAGDAGLFIVYQGEAIGPLTDLDADIVENTCECDPDLLVLPQLHPRPAPVRTA